MSLLSALQIRALRYWLWFKTRVHNRTAEPWLGALAFAESFLIPIPVDPFLVAMIIADRSRWAWTAFIATASSTAGALVGYGIGFFAFDLIGTWFASVTDRSVFVEKMTLLFSEHALPLTFAAALTPIPNAPVVIAAGFVSTNLFLFFLAWAVARAIRFFGVAYIVYAFGIKTLSFAERALNIGTVLLVLFFVGWFAYALSGV